MSDTIKKLLTATPGWCRFGNIVWIIGSLVSLFASGMLIGYANRIRDEKITEVRKALFKCDPTGNQNEDSDDEYQI